MLNLSMTHGIHDHVTEQEQVVVKPNVRVISRTMPVRILVANAKGGCGKTTMATNLASHFASSGEKTAIVDYDPQGSSIDWLAAREEHLPKIAGVAAFKRQSAMTTRTFSLRVPSDTTRIIIDTPAGLTGHTLSDLIQGCDLIVIPVIPSAIDIRAATGFIRDVLLTRSYRGKAKSIAVVANRVRKNTLIYQKLERFLSSLNIPFITSLRDTQHYVRASEHGLGLADFEHQDIKDKREWSPLIEWLDEQIQERTQNN